MFIEITARLYISDHDGYCSGNECEGIVKEVQHVVNLNEDIYKINKENMEYWKRHLPEPKLNTSGSYFCNKSVMCQKYGLDKHDYRYEVVSVKKNM